MALVMMFSLVTQAFAFEMGTEGGQEMASNAAVETSTAPGGGAGAEQGESPGDNTSQGSAPASTEEQFIAEGKQLLADWAKLTDDEKSDRAAYVMELWNELLETDEDSWDEEVYMVMADLENLSGGTETMWVGG